MEDEEAARVSQSASASPSTPAAANPSPEGPWTQRIFGPRQAIEHQAKPATLRASARVRRLRRAPRG